MRNADSTIADRKLLMLSPKLLQLLTIHQRSSRRNSVNGLKMMNYHLCLLLAFISLTFTGMAHADKGTEPPECKIAKAYLDADLIESAKKTLQGVISKDLTDTCISTTLENIAQNTRTTERKKLDQQIAQARALQVAGHFPEAIKILQSVVTVPDADEEVIEQLKKYKTDKKNADFDYVRYLADNGFYDDAVSEFKEAVKNNKGSKVPPELKYLNGGGIEQWRAVKQNIYKYVNPAGEILLAIFLVLTIIYLFVRWILFRPLLIINDFDDSSMSPKVGKSVTALLTTSYQGFAHGRGYSVTQTTGNPEGVSLPTAIEKALPLPLKNSIVHAVLAIFDKILPRRTYTVSGFLQNSQTKGAGLTLNIMSKKAQQASITIWTCDYSGRRFQPDTSNPASHVDQAGDFKALAEYAAIWLLYKFKHGFGLRSWSLRCWRMWRLEHLLGTKSWHAYALFIAGLHAERASATEDAKDFYIAALREDENLPIAKINIARLAENEESVRPFATTMLEQYLKWYKKSICLFHYSHEQSHYAAMYILAALFYDQGEDASALMYTNQLIEAIDRRDKQLFVFRLFGLFNFFGDLYHYLVFLRPVTMAMRGGLKVATNDITGGKNDIESVAKIESGFPRLQYNLACSYSILAAKESNKKLQETYLDKSISYLRTSNWLGQVVAKKAVNDRSLKEVRAKRGKEFKEIMQLQPELSKLPVTHTLAAFKMIGSDSAGKLAKNNIKTVSDLLRETCTKLQREKLARQIETGVEQIKSWAFAMELASLRGVETDNVNLLYDADIKNLNDLKGADPAILRLTLIDWAKTRNIKEVPDDSVVHMWVKEAHHAIPYIQI